MNSANLQSLIKYKSIQQNPRKHGFVTDCVCIWITRGADTYPYWTSWRHFRNNHLTAVAIRVRFAITVSVADWVAIVHDFYPHTLMRCTFYARIEHIEAGDISRENPSVLVIAWSNIAEDLFVNKGLFWNKWVVWIPIGCKPNTLYNASTHYKKTNKLSLPYMLPLYNI